MKPQVEKFLNEIYKDEALSRRFESLKTLEETRKFIAPYLDGLSAEEFFTELHIAQKTCGSTELSEDDLLAVAAGVDILDKIRQATESIRNLTGAVKDISDIANDNKKSKKSKGSGFWD